MTPSQAARDAAAKLTDAQKEGLTEAFEGSCNRLMVAFSTGSQASLCDLGLAVCPNRVGWPYLTPLGLEVRAILKRRIMTEDDRKLVEQMTSAAKGLYDQCRAGVDRTYTTWTPDLIARAAARITELSEQVEAKDARIAELGRVRDEALETAKRRSVTILALFENGAAYLRRALAAESALAKAQGEVERLRGALEQTRDLTMKYLRQPNVISIKLAYSRCKDHAAEIKKIARTALENHDDQ